jgi:hypothetical protein
MNVFNWFTTCFSNRAKAMFLYKRGMVKAKKRDHQGAIHDYSTTLGIPGTPPDLMAMVLYNRALVYVAAGDDRKGAEDLDAVLAMNEPLVNVKTLARQKLARMESRSSKSQV